MNEVQRWAREYRKRGLALARLKPGDKRPTYKEWNTYSYDPEKFREEDNIGLQTGPLSRNLVCVDLDDREVLAQADRYLPPTLMIDGRPGKRASHRWYLVRNVSPELTALPGVAGGIGGPRTRQFKGQGGQMLVEFRGTGSQAVVPPSLWTKEQCASEVRSWDIFEEPAEVDCGELFAAVQNLAEESGWLRPQACSSRKVPINNVLLPTPLPMPPGEAARQARAYVAKMDAAIQGKGGDTQTFNVACRLVIDFALSQEEALPILLEYNLRCAPPWSLADLQHKLAKADALEGERGRKIRHRSRKIMVNVQPSDPEILVGIDCINKSSSFVDLKPSLWTGMVKVGDERELVPELAAVDWVGRTVTLAPASTITTNKQEVWSEFFLALLLREEGAKVQSLRLPDLNGRRRTLAQTDNVDIEIVEPPINPWAASAMALEASQRAQELNSHRKALPRKKTSLKLNQAILYVREHGIKQLTKKTVSAARDNGISKETLRRALHSYYDTIDTIICLIANASSQICSV